MLTKIKLYKINLKNDGKAQAVIIHNQNILKKLKLYNKKNIPSIVLSPSINTLLKKAK